LDFGNRCATLPQRRGKTYPKDYVHPLKEINLEKCLVKTGLKVLEENATTALTTTAEGPGKGRREKLIKESRWRRPGDLLKIESFLRVVLKYLPEDEAYRNIYGEQMVIFYPTPDCDNDLK